MTDVMSHDELSARLRDLESAYSDQGRRAAREPIVKAFAAARRAMERERALDEQLRAEIGRNVGLEVELERERQRTLAAPDRVAALAALRGLRKTLTDDTVPSDQRLALAQGWMGDLAAALALE